MAVLFGVNSGDKSGGGWRFEHLGSAIENLRLLSNNSNKRLGAC